MHAPRAFYRSIEGACIANQITSFHQLLTDISTLPWYVIKCRLIGFTNIISLFLFVGDCLGVIHPGKASHWNIQRYLYMPFAKILPSFLMSVSTV